MFYPGGQYGLDKPLPSIRIEAIRDGLEEFELINSIKEYCEGLSGKVGSVDVEKAISTLTSNLYQGTQVISTEDAFYSARNNLKNVIDCMTSSAGMVLLDIQDNGHGTLSYKVYVNGNNELKRDGQPITTFTNVEGGRVYTVDLRLENSVNMMMLSFVSDGKAYSYPIIANGTVKSYLPNDIIQSFVMNSSNASSMLTQKEVVDGNVIGQNVEDKYLKLSVNATYGIEGNEKKQAIYIEKGFVSQINAQTSKLIFNLYYDGTEEETLYIRYKTNNLMANIELQKYSLKQGLNTIEIDCSSIKWKSNTVIDYHVLVIGEGTMTQPARELYVKDVVVYGE